jgi:predicted nuclease with TOPRIM domain
MTKGELRQMIREVLHEELRGKNKLKEAEDPKAAKAKEIRAKIDQLKKELAALGGDTSTTCIEVFVDGTSKKLTQEGIPHEQAIAEAIKFITKLTPEEKDKIGFYWTEDRYVAGDKAGETLLNIDPPSYYLTTMSPEEFKIEYPNVISRIVDNTFLSTDEAAGANAYDRIVAVLK